MLESFSRSSASLCDILLTQRASFIVAAPSSNLSYGERLLSKGDLTAMKLQLFASSVVRRPSVFTTLW